MDMDTQYRPLPPTGASGLKLPETITLRDQFAMEVMKAIVGDPHTRSLREKAEHIAETAYAVADAMLKARAG